MHDHRWGRAALAAAVLPFHLVSCQSYEPAPLDLARYREEWLARSVSSEPVVALARRLDARDQTATERFDPSDGLALDEGETVALVFSPALRVARCSAEVVDAVARYAGRWQDPVLGVDFERILASVDHPWIAGGTLGLTLPVSGRLEAEKDHATAASAAALSRLRAEEWQVRLALREAWFEWSASRDRVRLARETLAGIESLAGVVGRLEASGEIGRIDARLIKVEAGTVALDVQVLEARVRHAELRLRALMGLSPGATVALIESPLAVEMPATIAQSQASLEAGNVELALLRAEYEVSERALQRETREQYPDLEVNPGAKEEDGDTRLLFGFSLPLSLWNRNVQGIAEASMERELARAKFESAFERLSAELSQAYLEYEVAHVQRETLAHRLAPLADEQYAEVLGIAALGRLDPLVLLDAVTRQHTIKERLIDASLEETRAVNRIHALVGPSLPSALTAVDETRP